MFKRKKSVITVTFDPYHNLPMMKAKNCTSEQIHDAAIFMQGHVKIDRRNAGRPTPRRRKKKENRIHKFFRILGVLLFHREPVPSFEARRQEAYNCHHSFYPYSPDERVVPAALPTKV